MKNSCCTGLFLLLMLGPGILLGQAQLSLTEAQQDFDSLVSALQSHHQGLYLHLDKATTDAKLDSLRQRLEGGMDKLAFFRLVNAVLALTHEGHTSASLPRRTEIKLGLSKSFLPFTLRFFERKAYLYQYYGKEALPLQAGMEIVSINGVSSAELAKEMLAYIPTDGFNQTSAYAWMGYQFPLLYRLGWGPQTDFTVVFRTGEAASTQSLTLPAIRYTRIKPKHKMLEAKPLKHKRLAYEVFNDSVAYLAVNSFSVDKKKYAPWLAARFQEIKQAGIRHLVIDVQQNGGGTEGNENLLASYLMPKPFQKYGFVSMPKVPYARLQDHDGLVEDGYRLVAEKGQRGDFTLQSDYFSDLEYASPDTHLIFSGKVYLLISGITFSGGAEFASMIKMQDRGVIIGEESGGVYEGNVSGYSSSVKLKRSKIEVSIPIVHFKIDVNPALKSRGVMPDHTVPQTATDFWQGRNTKKEYVKQELLGLK